MPNVGKATRYAWERVRVMMTLFLDYLQRSAGRP